MTWKLMAYTPTFSLHQWRFHDASRCETVVLNFGCATRRWFCTNPKDDGLMGELVALIPASQKAHALTGAIETGGADG